MLVSLDILRKPEQSTTPESTEGTGSEKIVWWHEDQGVFFENGVLHLSDMCGITGY